MQYKKYIEGEPIPSSKRICNVCVCSNCGKEYLLGTRCGCGEKIYHKIFETLIDIGKVNRYGIKIDK